MITVTDIFHSERLYDMENEIIKKYGYKKAAYFDIETTGFSSKSQQIYMIGAAYKNEDGTFTMIQWFDDTTKDESKMLLMFREFLKDFDVLIHFNGNTFDVPFVLNRALKHGIHFNFDKLILIDVYKDIKKYKNFFKTPDLKQKSIEAFLGVFREDQYNGGQLIEVYKEFINLKENDASKNSLCSLLMLHNHDDMIGLVNICDIYAYTDIFEGRFKTETIALTEDSLMIGCKLESALKNPIFDMYNYTMCGKGSKKRRANENIIVPRSGSDIIKYEAHGNMFKILIPVIEMELKYFYENYKDYYYLPDEDTAIHKSVAQFVDKNHRKKATKENCYIKKSGKFVPQTDNIFQPTFKINHNDNLMFFEVNNDIIAHIIQDEDTYHHLSKKNNSCSLMDTYVKELFCGMYL